MRLINEAFFVRVPTFLTGMMIGARIKKAHRGSESNRYVLIYLASIVCIVLWLINAEADISYSRWIERAVFMPTAICIAIILGNCLEKCNEKIREMLIFLGGITLEIYLIHEKILLVCDTYISNSTVGSILSNCSAVLLAVLLSKYLSNLIGNLKCKVHKED